MGLFNKGGKQPTKSLYEDYFQKFMKEKDGKIHVLMVNSYGKWLNENFGCEDKYTDEINHILDGIQKDGYEIVDIKFNSLGDQGATGRMDGFHTLIMYK